MTHSACSVDGCDGRVYARGWCEKHYSRWKRHGDPTKVLVAVCANDGPCIVEGCTNPATDKDMCRRHYYRWWKWGDPLGKAPREDARIAFLKNVQVDPSGCWLWTAELTAAGYGRCADFGFGNRSAHRTAYEMFVGPIPDGMELDHVWANGCRHHNCVNWVDHLEPVTHQENMRRAAAAKPPIDRCRRAGHPYDEANTRYNTNGRRVCRACDKSDERRAANTANARARRKRLREQAA